MTFIQVIREHLGALRGEALNDPSEQTLGGCDATAKTEIIIGTCGAPMNFMDRKQFINIEQHIINSVRARKVGVLPVLNFARC